MSPEFDFNLGAKRTRLSDEDLETALRKAAEALGDAYFTSTQYDGLPGRRPHSATIIERFGSWKKALLRIGIAGGRDRRYDPEVLVSNLEHIWKELGYPPGKRQLSTLGQRISESPYKHLWGSVRAACAAIQAYHKGKLSREHLLAGGNALARRTVSLKNRHYVMKRDNFQCRQCGARPSGDPENELEVDHIIPVARGGLNVVDNLQTLCWRCNQGKKDR